MPITVFPPQIQPNIAIANAPDSATVTTTSTEIVAANPNRKWCFLTNVGNKDAFISFGSAAEVDKGIVLFSGGGNIVLGTESHTTEAINGITQAATTLILTLEGE